MRLAIYGCVSSILAIGVVLSAMHQRSNFYAACIYLSKSSACMMILLNMGLIVSLLFGKGLQTIFFGRLRAIEVEHLYERSWYAVTETCLAMTIFREEFDLQFIVVFTTLLFLKIFHWLCQDRVEYMEQSPTNRVTFHLRIVNLLAILLIIDSVLANHAINVTLTKGPNMMIMFGFEYTVLICTILSIIGKYVLNVIDLRSEQTWEGKSMFVFYLDLVTDFFKLVTYLVFFLYICFNYQLPLHIVRDVYVTFRSFVQKCRDLYRYRRATRNMNELYPNATAEDLTRSSDSTCIICREEMQIVDTTLDEDNPEAAAYRGDTDQNLDQPKKLPCGHIFHFHCLRSWLERQQTCPTCRRSVLVENNTPTPAPVVNEPQPFGQQPQPFGQQPQPFGQQPQPFGQQPQPFGQQPNPQHQQQGQEHAQYQHTPHFQQHPQYQQQPQPHQAHPHLFEQHPVFNQQQQGGGFTNHLGSSFNVLTPSTQPSPIPGLIPLVPMGAFHQDGDLPIPLPANLSDAELSTLSTVTREAMEQRLKVLETVQNQILQSMQTLTQVLSVIPVPQTDGVPQAETPAETQAKAQGESSSLTPKTTTSTAASLIELSDPEEEMSSRRREKMPSSDNATNI
ncbi:uncharacterized protein EV154DRAFT_438868 [Mucor mucedo]|uniref:uncharacterized protein n=1 Tax=Mucor mucedo TaxID=29922 RepID=UPI00221FAFEB|nr:uncharacterized protein EV154DRAFT_438868 [Mucor mucedo]KAI7893950.1 hypothetical protein EV154DRAFT_438868 [Mucor mucedo]